MALLEVASAYGKVEHPILNFRQDDFSGLENHFQGHLGNRNTFLQFLEPVQGRR